MARSSKQTSLFPAQEKAYGSSLLKKRKARRSGRPLATKYTMHLALRSTKAVGTRSFLKKETAAKIQLILKKFSEKYGVKLLSVANVGNHLHIHLKLSNRFTYAPFIRAITSAIAMAASGASRWKSLSKMGLKKFWDYRPFTRIVIGLRGWLAVRDYVAVNQLEGMGYSRTAAQTYVWMKAGRWRR